MCECLFFLFFLFFANGKDVQCCAGMRDRWNLNVQCKEKLTKGGLEPQMADKAYLEKY